MRPLLPALGASVLVAAAIVWTPLPGRDDADPVARVAVPVAATRAIAASPAAALVQFAPVVAASGAGGSAKPEPPVLVGFAGVGRLRTAYIMDAGQPVRARLGDKVGAWRVAAMGPHGVTLRSGGKSMALAFYGPRAAPPPATPLDTALAAASPAAVAPGPPPPPVQPHALEPASAPIPHAPRGGPRYWAGPPGSAPPGYIVLKPGELPPP
jgi:hypothetical protein